MNIIRTETATITDTCYAQKIAHNKYLPQFSAIITSYLRLGHNYFIFITNKASLLEYDILVKDNHPRQQTST
jgi:hypothetical protein